MDAVGEGVELSCERVGVGHREERLAEVLVNGERRSERIGEAGGRERRQRAAVPEGELGVRPSALDRALRGAGAARPEGSRAKA